MNERIAYLADRLKLVQGDLLDQASLVEAMKTVEPDEVYNPDRCSRRGAAGSSTSPRFPGRPAR
jgi:GDP-D-mannose dehydratase